MQNNDRAYEDGQALDAALDSAQHPADLIFSNQFCFGRLDTPHLPASSSPTATSLAGPPPVVPPPSSPPPGLNRYTSLVQGGLLSAIALAVPSDAMGKALKVELFSSLELPA